MFDIAIFEVVIGLIFIYWLLAIICSTVNEIIVGLIGLRARELQNGIRILLRGGDQQTNDQGVTDPSNVPTEQFIDNILRSEFIRGLTNKGKVALGKIGAVGPSYIPARTFVNSVFDTLFPPTNAVPAATDWARNFLTNPDIPEGLRAVLKVSADQTLSKLNNELHRLIADANITPEVKAVLANILTQTNPLVTDEIRKLLGNLYIPTDVRNLLINYLNQTDVTLEQFRTNLEQWYNDGMDRVAGWYKRKAQIIIAIIASGACLLFNIDTLAIADHLYRAPADRASLLALSQEVVKEGGVKGQTAQQRTDEILKITNKAAVAQLGWPEGFNLTSLSVGSIVLKVLGWALSVIAALFGAPFWFDLLKKSLNLRSAGNKPQSDTTSPVSN